MSAGGKWCRRVKEVLRLTTKGISEAVRVIACGLPTLHVSYRHPLPMLDVLSWVHST